MKAILIQPNLMLFILMVHLLIYYRGNPKHTSVSHLDKTEHKVQ